MFLLTLISAMSSTLECSPQDCQYQHLADDSRRAILSDISPKNNRGITLLVNKHFTSKRCQHLSILLIIISSTSSTLEWLSQECQHLHLADDSSRANLSDIFPRKIIAESLCWLTNTLLQKYVSI